MTNYKSIILLTSTLMCASAVEARDITQLELLRCTSFETTAQKLNCFESLIEALPMAVTESDITDKEDSIASLPVKATFGLSEKQKKIKEGKKLSSDKDESYHATITQVQEGNYRILYFTTEEGHVWRQVEARRFWYPKKKPFKVTIVQGRMGNYQLKVDGKGEFASVKRLK